MTPFTVGFLDHEAPPFAHAKDRRSLRVPTMRLKGYFLAADKKHFEMCIKRDLMDSTKVFSYKCFRPYSIPAELKIFGIEGNSSYSWYKVEVNLADYLMLAAPMIWIEG